MMQALPSAVDLNDCERESIRIPGAIQPHGFLMCLSDALTLLQAAENLALLTGEPVEQSLGKHLSTLIGAAATRAVATAAAQAELADNPLYLGRFETAPVADGICLDLIVHRRATLLILEMEVTRRLDSAFSPIYPLVRTFIAALQDTRSVIEAAQLAAREVRRITGFGRTLVYHFEAAGHGRVLAEDRQDDYPSYLHHQFPASDIPKQARELYLAHRLRLIADADYQPARLVPSLHPLTGAPTDLSFAALRSVSPVHLEYMRNMGTPASMSISIIVRGQLWGLISCHHHSPRVAPFEVRMACEHLGQILSLQIEAKEDSVVTDHKLELRRSLVTLLAAMADRNDLVEGLRAEPEQLLRFMSAAGAAIVYEERITLLGATPPCEDVARIAEWLGAHRADEVFATDSLQAHIPAAADWGATASGILAVAISKLHRNFVIWFRPEVVRSIEWAGDPRKNVIYEGAQAHMSPRKSFDTWVETVRGYAPAWRASETEMALEFRAAVLGTVLRRAEEMAALATELGRANKELESFSYSVSHDLRAPLRHVAGYGDLLRDNEGDNLSERGGRYLQNMIDAARLAGTLVDELLTFSQMGRAALHPVDVDLRKLVDGLIVELQAETGTRRIEWTVGDLPTV
ncbi:MAG: GAF domain-containing protein, partial [Janthinobacterium lividum]